MKGQPVSHDERTESVENVSYRFAYLVMSFGLLASVAYRSFMLGQSSWDLLALVLLGGVTATFYQGTHRILSPRWLVVTLATVAIAGLLALAVVLAR